jgi:hypothetical protein
MKKAEHTALYCSKGMPAEEKTRSLRVLEAIEIG